MRISKKNHILKMNAHFEKELHFEDESMALWPFCCPKLPILMRISSESYDTK